MWETSGRLLRLLALLQQQRGWSAEQLAAHLAVTGRTVRRDVARLREGGYPIQSTYGTGGGYRMEPGTALPPLLIDADEAVAVRLALQAARVHRDHRDELLETVSDKIEAVMPGRLDSTMEALYRHADFLDISRFAGMTIDAPPPLVLIRLARACRERRRVDVEFSDSLGRVSIRRIEPLRLAYSRGAWHAVVYMLDTAEWRVIGLDRFRRIAVTAVASFPRQQPATDLDRFVREHTTVRGLRDYVIWVGLGEAAVRRWVLPAWGRVEAAQEGGSIVRITAPDTHAVARWILLLNTEVRVREPAELREAFALLSKRAGRASGRESDDDVGAEAHPRGDPSG
ncbi:WYL domain-containing protein [Mycetocola tolaasinivorans]|uniref:WYL domain-containing protein n=1 Tax=Mycetocola tolaasinivorans TaxID=76635 RepID=A0A3L7AC16_9MICO|nr:WYL domain-containing protein [Mycetocola tolaasinivorans]RLP77545.1 WYL domain-containing protein [Mycetocola tolaasinivorans]